MKRRSYSWPDGHWDWCRHLAFKHGVHAGRMIFGVHDMLVSIDTIAMD